MDQENARVNNAVRRCHSETNISCSPSIRRVPRLKAIDKYHLFRARPDLDFGEKLPELTKRFSNENIFATPESILTEAEVFYDTLSYNEEGKADADGDVFFEAVFLSDHDSMHSLPSKDRSAAHSQHSEYMHFWAEMRATSGTNSPSVQTLTAA